MNTYTSKVNSLVDGVTCIAKPLANEKLTNKILKLIRKASKRRALYRGVKEINKVLSKKKLNKGILILAGNVTPIDVISHLPVLAEDAEIPYIFIPTKEYLGMYK